MGKMLIHKGMALFLCVLLAVLAGCEKTTAPDAGDDMYCGIALMQTRDANCEYMAIDEAGNLVGYNVQNTRVTESVCRAAQGAWMTMTYDANGYPESAVTTGCIILFDNFTGTHADLAIINTQTDEITVLREVEFDMGGTPRGWYGEVASALQLATIGLQAFAQTSTMLNTEITAISPFTFALGEVSHILTVVSEVQEEHFDELEASAAGFEAAADAIQSTADDCLEMLINAYNTTLQAMDLNAENVQAAKGVLGSGHGDIQITLTWNTTADIDLYVTDPLGETIYFENPTSASGGWLDEDDMDGFGPENIYWADDVAPFGTYGVCVDYYSGTGSASYTVCVVVEGAMTTYRGTIDEEQHTYICSFTY